MTTSISSKALWNHKKNMNIYGQKITKPFNNHKISGGFPYSANGAQITPPPYFWFFVFSYFGALFRLGLGLPRKDRKEVQLGPRRVRAAPAMTRIRRRKKLKNKGGGESYLSLKSKKRDCLKYFYIYVFCSLTNRETDKIFIE